LKVLITGNLGYLGSVLTMFLARAYPGAQLLGYDSGFFAHALTGANFLPERQLATQYYGDVRDISPEILEGVDSVVHLAAVSNDPLGNEFEEVTAEINREATLRLASLAVEARVKNFVFASSCSMYGFVEGGARTETDPTNPLTAYARSKVGAETDLRESELSDMVVTSLRFATACGWSPRMRLDLVLNDFVVSAITSGEITVLSDGTPWRPLIDVEDMSRAIAWALTRTKAVGGQFLAVNAGSNKMNYQVKDLAEAVASLVCDTKISINKDAPPDSRSYSVDFSLYESLAPEFQPAVSLNDSILRISRGFENISFLDKDFRRSSFMRLNTMREHICEQRLGQNLRWKIF
jgi:nucleoside-diphosphate-sugar epimerase